MKILNPFRFYRGSGGDKSPWPALVPPSSQNVLKSISISETVDALCEGPIYGLVDQFGKKIYGLDMLKGIYLNKMPVMNSDGKYNFRNILMEINLGTETQKPLQNFTNVHIYKPANFKLLGPINHMSADKRYDPNNKRLRDFSGWAIGWPATPKDPFVYVHHIKNKDVKKIKIGLIIEALYDTNDTGSGPGQAGTMGMSKESQVTISVTCGVENANTVFIKDYTLVGTVLSPYACTLGETVSQFSSTVPSMSSSYTGSSVGPSASNGGRIINTSSLIGGVIGPFREIGRANVGEPIFTNNFNLI